jgi:hypothetical protein
MTSDAMAFDKLDKKELKELLNKGWMTHDAMWFRYCLQEFGIEKTNIINKTAIRAMAATEVKRIQKAMDVDKPESFQDLKLLFNSVMSIALGDFMNFAYSFPAHNMIHTESSPCFAYEGLKALGVMDHYECGVKVRIDSWLDTLDIRYEVEPEVTYCMMYTDGKCYRDYRFFFTK